MILCSPPSVITQHNLSEYKMQFLKKLCNRKRLFHITLLTEPSFCSSHCTNATFLWCGHGSVVLESLYTVLYILYTALQAALELAEQISSFPQQCLRADRSSAFYSCYDAPSFTQVPTVQFYVLTSNYRNILPEAIVLVNKTFLSYLTTIVALTHSNSHFNLSSSAQALQHEFDRGTPVIQLEAVSGAARFSTGEGRGGKFI